MKKVVLLLVVTVLASSVYAAESQIQNYVNKKISPLVEKEKEFNAKIEAQKQAEEARKAELEKKQAEQRKALEEKQAEQKKALEDKKAELEKKQAEQKKALETLKNNVENEKNYWKSLFNN